MRKQPLDPRNEISIPTRAFVALGSNLGKREQFIHDALIELNRCATGKVTRVSPIYETEAVGFIESASPFLNGVAEIQSIGSAEDLLSILLQIETHLGRIRSDRKGYQSRTIDLDLLLFGEERLQTPKLTIPHPHLMQRRFVLQPLADLVPETIIPGTDITVQQALDRLASPESSVHRTTLSIW